MMDEADRDTESSDTAEGEMDGQAKDQEEDSDDDS
jgi:hypothetical protein